MIFSDPRVSAFVRANFVAAWESVRPVPLVEIDFGNGRKLKRTVNGNIATYLCAPDGRVLDVIPGLNTPEAYLAELQGALRLFYRATRVPFEPAILAFHAAKLAAGGREEAVLPVLKDVGKRVVELPLMNLQPEAELLAADTEFNRKERKPLIHRILSERIWRPAELTKRVYKEALHCDLDDPYLGLRSGAFNGGRMRGAERAADPLIGGYLRGKGPAYFSPISLHESGSRANRVWNERETDPASGSPPAPRGRRGAGGSRGARAL